MIDCCVFRLLDDMYDWLFLYESSYDFDRFHFDEERPLVGYDSADSDEDEYERIQEEKRRAKEQQQLQQQKKRQEKLEMRSVLAKAFKRGSKASAMYKASLSESKKGNILYKKK